MLSEQEAIETAIAYNRKKSHRDDLLENATLVPAKSPHWYDTQYDVPHWEISFKYNFQLAPDETIDPDFFVVRVNALTGECTQGGPFF